jgi:hypothetical protein
VLRATNNPVLFQHIRHSTGIDDIDKVTFEDLVNAYEGQGGRDRSWYDQPQIKTRSNRGMHDRKVLRTKYSYLRAEESSAKVQESDSISESSDSREHDRGSECPEDSMSEIDLWTGKPDFELVSDCEFATNHRYSRIFR